MTAMLQRARNSWNAAAHRHLLLLLLLLLLLVLVLQDACVH
jgi:hypothetical protein